MVGWYKRGVAVRGAAKSGVAPARSRSRGSRKPSGRQRRRKSRHLLRVPGSPKNAPRSLLQLSSSEEQRVTKGRGREGSRATASERTTFFPPLDGVGRKHMNDTICIPAMEPLDLMSLLPPELWFQQFVTLDGLHSGVPTRTTPTLTPTTLRNIEQTFIELQCEAESHQNEAGFVPPVVQPITQAGSTCMTVVDTKGWQGGITSVAQSQSRPSVVTAAPTIQTSASTTRRNMGGRRPAKTVGISPEEEERRRIRRERNKMAAARCRKRRVDHTNALLIETEQLENKKQGLQNEIQQLQMEKEELEFLLEAHKPCCRIHGNSDPPSPPDVKPFAYSTNLDKLVVPLKRESQDLAVTTAGAIAPLCAPPPAKKLMLGSDATSGAKPPRPNSLPVAAAFTPSQNTLKAAVSVTEVAGIPLTTPTTGLPFNFDSLMEGGTGLTPVSGPLVPSCSSQQRNSGCVDLSSPDSVPPKLVSL